MQCKNCNQEIPDGSKFCTYCGTVQDVPEPTIPAVPDVPPAPADAYGSQEPVYAAPAPVIAPAPQPQPAPVPMAAPVASYAPDPAAQGSAYPPAQQPYGVQPGAQPGMPPQQTYAPGASPYYQAPPKKKSKLWIVFLIVGVLVLGGLITGGVIVVGGLLNSGGTGGGGGGSTSNLFWNGGVDATNLPTGFTALANNSHITIGIGQVRPYTADNTVTVDLAVVNNSGNAVYLIFNNNVFDGVAANDNDVYVSILRSEPGASDTGVVYIDALHDANALTHWTGTIYVIDDDTYYSSNPTVLDVYNFDVTYNH
ncbi:MAG: zinc-ribbon domain-containing protein [Actinomycetia bacterium]|nr:zinc-ribbon domain-containing protein [Actinomycetes bacterium]